VAPLGNLMTVEESEHIIGLMANGAKKAREIGYDGVEIQASYGGLIAQLLSPLLNKRSDKLGGCFENRVSFLVQVIKRVKKNAGHSFPVMVKLVCDEFVPGGLNLSESKKIAHLISKAGTDAIVANAGNKTTKYLTIPCNESPPAPLAEISQQIKAAVGIPVVSIGKIGDPLIAEDILSQGKADFVAMARALVADPDFPVKIEKGEIDDIRRCAYCLEDCSDKGVPGIGRCCAMNPYTGQEHRIKNKLSQTRKKILVIGGGPAGIQVALTADLAGHNVTLWEKESYLGGLASLMHKAPYKNEMKHAVDYLENSLKKSQVHVRLGKEAEINGMLAFDPDILILAIGSNPISPMFPGMDVANVMHARSIYLGTEVTGHRVAIIGGGISGVRRQNGFQKKENK